MPRFGKDNDARKEELDRQAAEEVEKLIRRGGPPGMGGGMPGMGGAPMGIPSPLEQIAEEVRDAPRPSMRRQASPRRAAPKPQQAFTPMPSGGVGSSFGPGGLNPGPRTGAAAPPPPAFGGGAYDEDYGGSVSGPPVFNADPDEDEEMTITEMALMDHAARTGHAPEDLVMQYDASSAEEMRDIAMRKFYERQQARRPNTMQTNNPFAPAGMRGGGPVGPASVPRNQDPAAAGGALAQRLANRRRREEEEARRAQAAASEPGPAPAAASAPKVARAAAPPTPRPEPAVDEGALARVLARRRQMLGVDTPEPEPEPEPEPQPSPPPGRRHATSREESSPGLRSVPLQPVVEEGAPSLEDMATSSPGRRTAKKSAPARSAGRAAKAPAAKKSPKAAPAAKAPVAKKSTTAAPAVKATKAKAKKGGATLATAVPPTAPAAKASAAKGRAAKAPAAKAPAARKVGKAKTVFCIECGEKNPAIAKFCFNCGTRLAAPET